MAWGTLGWLFPFSPLYPIQAPSSRDGGTCIQGRSSTFSQPSVEASQTYPEVCLSDLVGDLKPQ